MGFFKRLFSEKEAFVDLADLTLSDVISTDHPGIVSWGSFALNYYMGAHQ